MRHHHSHENTFDRAAQRRSLSRGLMWAFAVAALGAFAGMLWGLRACASPGWGLLAFEVASMYWIPAALLAGCAGAFLPLNGAGEQRAGRCYLAVLAIVAVAVPLLTHAGSCAP